MSSEAGETVLFGVVRIRKREIQRLKNKMLSKESMWETVKRILDEHEVLRKEVQK